MTAIDATGASGLTSFVWTVNNPLVTVPDLEYDTVAQARVALTAAGLVLGTVTTYVDRICNYFNQISSQTPLAGTKAELGTAVNVRVGLRYTGICP